MTKRSSILIAAFALLASLAFTTPSRAGAQFIIESETIDSSGVVITGYGTGNGTFTASAANPLPSATYTAPDFPNQPPPYATLGTYTPTYTGDGSIGAGDYATYKGALVYDVTIKDVASNQTGVAVVTVNFNGTMFAGSGSFTPTSVTMNPVVIGSNRYALYGYSLSPAGGTSNTIIMGLSVPEPASMSLLGIGVAGLLSFRRIFKRKASV